MRWYELDLVKLADMIDGEQDKESLTAAVDIKYGNYDYAADARSAMTHLFADKFSNLVNENVDRTNGSKVLVCGVNSGYEVKYLGGLRVTGLDLSKTAIRKFQNTHPHVHAVHASIDKLPFIDDTFDLYVAMRTIHCSSVDMPTAVAESMRVVKDDGTLIYSIPNAYLVDGEIKKGLYDCDRRVFDEQMPLAIINQIKAQLDENGYESEILDFVSEYVLKAKKR